MDNLTVLIPYRDNRAALGALLDTIPPDLPVVVVDDASAVAPARAIGERPGLTRIRRPSRGYFSGAVNTGLEAIGPGRDVLVLNQDVRLCEDEDWRGALERLAGRYAVIGDGVVHRAWSKGYVQGTFMYLRADALKRVGPFDAVHWPLWGATAEWQLRACRAGFEARPIVGLGWFRHARRGEFGSAIQRLLADEPQRRGLYLRTPPLVSVVVPCHNYGRYLPDLVASLVGGPSSLGPQPGQTFQGFEVVLVDDASTDDSAQGAERLADPWQGVRAVRRATCGGTAAAMNSGIRASYGRYVFALDADDMLEPEALERCLTALEAAPHHLIYTDQRLFGGGERGEVVRLPDYDFGRLLERNHVPAGVLFARADWERVGGYPEAFRWGRQDWAWAVRLGAAGVGGLHLAEPLYLYRREGQNRTLTNTDPESMRFFRQQMRQAFPDLYRPPGVSSPPGVPSPPPGGGEDTPARQGDVRLLEYVGPSTAAITERGPVTGRVYRFGGRRPAVYVDGRDADALLGLRKFRRALYRAYEPPQHAAQEEGNHGI